jgi:hypothetical protein
MKNYWNISKQICLSAKPFNGGHVVTLVTRGQHLIRGTK